MIISKVHIDKFRKMQDIEFKLGNKITLIVGQNGTMKTTLLGIIAQPFSLKRPGNPLRDARAIDGSILYSQFTDKFKLCPKYEKPGDHCYTLFFTRKDFYDGKDFYVAKSFNRPKNAEEPGFRIWSAEGREGGMGYVQLPVIYLSLKRLIPVGEEKVTVSPPKLSDEERDLFISLHKDILILDDDLLDVEYIRSSSKQNKSSLGVRTPDYNSLTNSAGQDNVGKIILALLSFKRIQEQYPNDYKGGLLLIDELDATMFPGAQERLLKKLLHYSGKYKIQIICTTHSFSAIQEFERKEYRRDCMLLFLKSSANRIVVEENTPLEQIIADLNVTAIRKKSTEKFRLYCEDKEAFTLIKNLIPSNYKSQLQMMDKVTLGADELLNLAQNNIPEFNYNIIILDGDQSHKKLPKNFCTLPGVGCSPEKIFFPFLQSLPDDDIFWSQTTGEYRKQFCFKGYSGFQPKSRDDFKKWFNSQKAFWGRGCTRLITRWKKDNQEEVNTFLEGFEKAYQYVLKKNK